MNHDQIHIFRKGASCCAQLNKRITAWDINLKRALSESNSNFVKTFYLRILQGKPKIVDH